MSAEAIPNILESHARDVTSEIFPNDDLKGIDPISILTIVITIFQSIIQACPKPPATVASELRRPSMRQRAALMKKAIDVAQSQGQGYRAGQIYRAMLNKASQLSEADALALVDQASNDSNLLI